MIANSLFPLRCSVCLDCQLSKLPSTSTLFPPWVQLMAVGTSAGSVVAHAGYSPPCRPCDGMGTVGVCGLFEIVRESSSSVVRPFPASLRRSLTPRPSPLASSRPPRARARRASPVSPSNAAFQTHPYDSASARPHPPPSCSSSRAPPRPLSLPFDALGSRPPRPSLDRLDRVSGGEAKPLAFRALF